MAPGAVPVRGSPLFTLLLLGWFFGAYGLVVWGAVSDRGPCAFLIDWQRAAFGGSSLILGALIGAVLVFWGPSWAGKIAARLWPQSPSVRRYNQLMRLAMMSRGEAAARARVIWAAMDDAARARSLRRRRNGALIAAGLLVVASFAVNRIVSHVANADAGQPLRRVSLADGAPLLPPGATPWVTVQGAQPLMDGVMERHYTIRSHHYLDDYTPLVPPGWQAGDPIRLVELDSIYGQSDLDPPGPIEGQLSDDGPRPEIAALFRQNGYAVDDATVVLTRQNLHGVIPGEDPFLGVFIWYMGGLFTLIALLIAGLAERQRRRL